MAQTTFNQLVQIYKQITFFDGRKGRLIINDQVQLDLLKSALDDPRNTGIYLKAPVLQDELIIGSTVEVEAGDPRTGLGLLADNFDDILNFRKGRFEEPRNYYLLPDSWASTDSNPPEIVTKYRALIEFINLLSEAATYIDKERLDIIFVHPAKLVLPLSYESSDINTVDTEALKAILTFFNADMHREHKLKIFEKTLYVKLKGITENERFTKVLSGFAGIFQELKEGYSLFAADFSYEKIVNQLEVAKLEELGKINKTFSEIQNQILGIPVATIIVATQLKTTEQFNDIFWINTAILVGVWIFAALLILVIRNQSHTLDAIKLEIKRKKSQIDNEFPAIKPVVTKTFELLNRRVRHQRIALYAVDVVVVFGLFMAHVIYFVLTIPAQRWLHALFSCG